jgi:hypothetical protein
VSYAPDDKFQAGTYLQTVGDSETFGTDHAVTIIGLQPGTRYHYQVKSGTEIGTETASPDFTFLTSERAVSILNYAANVLTPNSARFRWQTSIPTSTEVTVTPYRGGRPQQDTARSFHGDPAAIKHEMVVSAFEPGVRYDVELWGMTDAGLIVSKTLTRFATSTGAAVQQIQNVQADTAISPGKDSRIQVVISWNTTYDSTSQVFYQQGVNSDPSKPFARSTLLDESYTRNHVTVLPSLNPGEIYSFAIESRDSNDIPSRSTIYTLLTPRQEEGVFQVILKQLEGAFGWVGQLRGQ